jgi:hypothetical protein
MFHRLNDKGDNLLTGCPEKRIAAHIWKIYDFKIEVVPFIINFITELTTVVKFEVYILTNTFSDCNLLLMKTLASYLSTQGFQSGPVPGTFTRLRSCIVPAEITESPKISHGQNHKYDRLVEYFS